MSINTKNLGLIKAIHVGVNPPVNIKMLWYNITPNDNSHYYYDVKQLKWVKLIGLGTGGNINRISNQANNIIKLLNDGLFAQETITSIVDFSVSNNKILTLKYRAEDNNVQVKTVDLKSLFPTTIRIKDFKNENNVLKIIESDDTIFSVDLSSLNSIQTENSNTIELVGDGSNNNKLQANLIVSKEQNNTLEVKNDGLYNNLNITQFDVTGKHSKEILLVINGQRYIAQFEYTYVSKTEFDKTTGDFKTYNSDSLIPLISNLDGRYAIDTEIKKIIEDTKTELNKLIDSKVTKIQGFSLVNDDDWATAQTNITNILSKLIDSVTVTGENTKKISINLKDGSKFEASWQDLQGTGGGGITPDIRLNSIEFDINTGVFTGRRSDNVDLTADLNGRWSLLGHKHTLNDITDIKGIEVSSKQNTQGDIEYKIYLQNTEGNAKYSFGSIVIPKSSGDADKFLNSVEIVDESNVYYIKHILNDNTEIKTALPNFILKYKNVSNYTNSSLNDKAGYFQVGERIEGKNPPINDSQTSRKYHLYGGRLTNSENSTNENYLQYTFAIPGDFHDNGFYLYNNPTDRENNNLNNTFQSNDTFDNSYYNNWIKIIGFYINEESGDKYETIRNTSFIFDLNSENDTHQSKFSISYDKGEQLIYHKYIHDSILPDSLNYNSYSFELKDSSLLFSVSSRNKIDHNSIDLIISRTNYGSEFLFYKNTTLGEYAILNTGGIKKENSSDEYVLLGGGGHKKLSEITSGGSSSISYNDLTDKPSLDFIPTSWNNRGGKEVFKTQIDDWLRINENGSHPNGTYFGAYRIRTDKGIQVGEGGNKFHVNEEGEVNIKNKAKIVVRDNGNIAFGNMDFNDLVYGEFKGIKIWCHDSDDKVILAGGGVKNINEIAPSYKTITDAHKFLDKDGAIHFGSGAGIENAPSGNFFEMVGFTHSNKNWGFIIAKNIDEDDKTLYVKQVINGNYTDWLKIKENNPVGNIINSTRQILSNEADKVIFVTNSIDNCALNMFPDRCSVTFRKVFDGGYVNFTCLGKNIIYTVDNQFNGKKGSTAVVSIYENDCYIDIRNI